MTFGDIKVICSHRRGEQLILCCVSELNGGQAVAFQISALSVENDDFCHIHESPEAAIKMWKDSEWPHA